MGEALGAAYLACARQQRYHGRSFYAATLLLPEDRRRGVYALYAFARFADDLVDVTEPADGGSDATGCETRQRRLAVLRERFLNDLAAGWSRHPLLAAVIDTAQTYAIPADAFVRFLRSMQMDLTVNSYETWEALVGYMDGSAAVIGEMMLPILNPRDRAAAIEPARDLGLAFQVTNFLRDIAVDLDLGRQYVPQEDLRRFGVDLTERKVTEGFIEMMRFEIGRCRALYESSSDGIALLPARSARCVLAARRLYSATLTSIERRHYDVFRGRVSTGEQLRTVACRG